MVISSCLCPTPLVSPIDEVWKNKYSPELEKYIIPTNNPRWGRLLMSWNEVQSDGTVHSHKYAACIDLQEQNFYLDDLPGKIYRKCLVQTCARPLHTIIKTLYHLCMIPIFIELGKSVFGSQSLGGSFTNCIKSLADIVRTPLYGLTIMIVSVALLVIGPFAPDSIYSYRKVLGEIEQAQNWGYTGWSGKAVWTLSSCFQPFELSYLSRYE